MSELFSDGNVQENAGAPQPAAAQQDLFSSIPLQDAPSSGVRSGTFEPPANDPASAVRGGDGNFLDSNEISNTGLYSARYGAKYCERNKKQLQVTWKRSEPVSFDLTEEELKACTLGSLLSSARKRCELKLEDVVALTKIRSEFVRALEEDNVGLLPPGVFVSAYLRTLADLYNVDAGGKELLKAKFSVLASGERNDGLSRSAAGRIEQTASINVDELRKMKKAFIFSVSVMVVLCVIVGCVAASCGRSSAIQDEAATGDAAESRLLMEKPDIDVLTVPEMPELSVLKISPVPAIAE